MSKQSRPQVKLYAFSMGTQHLMVLATSSAFYLRMSSTARACAPLCCLERSVGAKEMLCRWSLYHFARQQLQITLYMVL